MATIAPRRCLRGMGVEGRAIYIVDDHAGRSALEVLVAGAAFSPRAFATSEAFLAEIETLAPGCVLLELRTPGFDGFQLLERLADRRAALPTVAMTGHCDIATAVRAMKLGACDFIEKPIDGEVLLDVLERAFAVLDDGLRDRSRRDDARTRLARLTAREREVLTGLLTGRANKLIAYDLDISVRTVEMHRAAMMERLGVRTLAEALRLAIEGDVAVPLGLARALAGSG